MRFNFENPLPNELRELCTYIRDLVRESRYDDCIPAICRAMETYPHAPQPHNLLGIVLEKTGDHATAMKHFRAAWALDPTYSPANHNLTTYGTFFTSGSCAFDESDLTDEDPSGSEQQAMPQSSMEIVYDERGIGRIVSKTRVQYDERGIGHVVRR